ncbi:unnamed protein product [Musa hybrid cultivar]
MRSEKEEKEKKERKNLRRSSGKFSIMVFVAPKKLTVLLIIVLASLPSIALAGKSFGYYLIYVSQAPQCYLYMKYEDLSKHGLHQQQISIVHYRILKVNTKDYGSYDPSPSLSKPPFKLIPN